MMLLVLLLLVHVEPWFDSADPKVFFTVIHTNDEHAAIIPAPQADYHPTNPNPSLGGFARLATKVNEIRQQKAATNEPVLLLSGGDFISGSAFSWLVLTGEIPELDLMQKTGYDVIVLGNHEFDYGPEVLADYLKKAGYPEANSKTVLLSSNIEIPDGHPLAGVGLQRTHLRQLPNGPLIGFFGLMGKEADAVAPMAKPITFNDQHETARTYVKELKDAGADIIIAITHSGVQEDVDLANDVPGIDVIIGGHTHTTLPQPVMAGNTIIVQTGSVLEHLGYLEFAWDAANRRLRLLNNERGHSYLIPIDSSIPENPYMNGEVAVYQEKLNRLVASMTQGAVRDIRQVIAQSEFALPNQPVLRETPLGNFVTDAIRLTAASATGRRVDAAFLANGVIRGTLKPGETPWGKNNITFFDLSMLVGLGSGSDNLPGYPLVSVYFTGEELRRVLEITILLSELMSDIYYLQSSGLQFLHDPERAVLVRIPFAGTPIPTLKSVLEASIYTGEGLQTGNPADYKPLEWKDETLYHVVSDYYNASFLPMVGEMLPDLSLVMKDENGNPVSLDDRIIYRNGEQLKVWQAVTEFAMNQPQNDAAFAAIPARYESVAGRHQITGTFPLLYQYLLVLLVAGVGVGWVAKKLLRKNRK